MNTHNISIGKILQEEVYQLNISLHELSEKMFLSEKALLNLFKSKSIEVTLLYKWCSVLKIDFFEIYSQNLSINEPNIELGFINHNSN
jgi:transposase